MKILKKFINWFHRLIYGRQAKKMKDTIEQDESDTTNGIDLTQCATADNAIDTDLHVKCVEPTPSLNEREDTFDHHQDFNTYSETLKTPYDQEPTAHNVPISQLFDSDKPDQVDGNTVDSEHDQAGKVSEPFASDTDKSKETSSFSSDDNPDISTVSPLDSDTLASFTGGAQGTLEHSDFDIPKSKEKDKIKRQGPRNIGSRRYRNYATKSGPDSRRRRIFRPELTCQKIPGSGIWKVVLSAEDCPLESVEFEGERLEFVNQEYSVPTLNGNLVVSYKDGQKVIMSLFDSAPLFFKMRKNWTGRGRKTSGITNGHFIVIAPSTWERIGRPSVEPDSCLDPYFLAHYFYRDATTQYEDLDGFSQWDIFPTGSGINLTGQCVYDDSEEGTLFVNAPPVLNLSPSIEWVRVGEEAEHGWKGENFEPAKQSLADILEGRNGHFFLRVYDSQEMLDSVEFRYLHELEQIRVNGRQYTKEMLLLPNSSGYSPAEVCFVGTDESTILPVMFSEGIHETPQSGILEVPPHPDADSISCIFGSDAGSVRIVLELPRIWWRLDYTQNDHGDTNYWHDTPLAMTRHQFRDHARQNAKISVVSKRFRSIHVGFGDELDRVCRRTASENHISIPLAEFVDYKQIDQRLSEDTYFNIRWGKHLLPLIYICADPMPEIISFSVEPATISEGQEAILKWATRNVDEADVVIDPDIGVVDTDGIYSVRPTKTTNYTLTLAVSDTVNAQSIVTVAVDSLFPVKGDQRIARVKCPVRGWRTGKGFSYREIEAAVLTVQRAMSRSILIDKRRRSAHPSNVEKIRRMLYV